VSPDRGHGQLHPTQPRHFADGGWRRTVVRPIGAVGPIVWAAGFPKGNLQKCIRRRAGRSHAAGADIGRTHVPATPASDHRRRTRQRRSEASPTTSDARSDVQQYEPDHAERRAAGVTAPADPGRAGCLIGSPPDRRGRVPATATRPGPRVEFEVAVGAAGVRAQRHGDTCRHRGDPAGQGDVGEPLEVELDKAVVVQAAKCVARLARRHRKRRCNCLGWQVHLEVGCGASESAGHSGGGGSEDLGPDDFDVVAAQRPTIDGPTRDDDEVQSA
jgi:hypothetical protein